MDIEMKTASTTEIPSEKNLFLQANAKRELITLPPDASVLDAVKLMRDHHVGDVVVVEKRNDEAYPIGIVTDRDLSLNVLAQCADPEFLRISAVMSRDLIICPEFAGIFQMIRTMSEKGVSRLLLVNETGVLRGIVTARHLSQLLLQGLNQLTHISERQNLNEEKSQH